MSFLSSLTSGVSGAVECAFSEVLSVGQSGSGSFFEGDLGRSHSPQDVSESASASVYNFEKFAEGRVCPTAQRSTILENSPKGVPVSVDNFEERTDRDPLAPSPRRAVKPRWGLQ